MASSHEAIVISDDDSETVSESERDPPPPPPPRRTQPVVTPGQPTSSRGTASISYPNPAAQPPRPSPSQSLPDSAPASSTSAPSSLAALMPDRAQMERQRLERNRKRRREQGEEVSPDGDVRPEKVTKTALPSSTETLPATLTATAAGSSTPLPGRADPIRPTDRFWEGAIKLSYNRFAAVGQQGCTLGSFLLPATPTAANGLKRVVMATYDLDMAVLYPLFPRAVDVTLIFSPPADERATDPDSRASRTYPSAAIPEFRSYPGWRICLPRKPRGQRLIQHMKFFILEHEDFVRVAILTGNLNGYDWNLSENVAFVQDFRWRPAGSAKSTLASAAGPPSSRGLRHNDFADQLRRVLNSLSIDSDHEIWTALDRADFSTSAARIVASWPERVMPVGWPAIEAQGLGRLGKVVRDMHLPTEAGGVVVEAQGSSLGVYNSRWLEQFHLLASGIQPQGVLPLTNPATAIHRPYLTATRRSGTTNSAQQQRDGFDTRGYPPVKVLFPTQRYVENEAVGGPESAGTFFGQPTTFARSPLKHLYHQPRSARGDIMMHAKSLLAFLPSERDTIDGAFQGGGQGRRLGHADRKQRTQHDRSEVTAGSGSKAEDKGKETDAERPIGWVYMGSANLTMAAHGNIAGKIDSPTLSTSNWELGVVLPIFKSEVESQGAECMALRAIPYRRPVEAYGEADTPWDVNTLK